MGMGTGVRPRASAALAMAMVVVVSLGLSGCLRPGQNSAYQALMTDRQALGLRTLPIQGNAQTKAQAWADHLAATGTLVHSHLPDGFESVHWCSIGENIGTGPSAAAIEKAYLASPTHHAIIVDTKWNGVGIGYAQKGKQIYTVQVFVKTC